MQYLEALSFILGWVYFFSWSISFYPQIILNYKRKSVSGLSQDFVILNLIGFTCYSIYNLAFYFSTTIQREYFEKFGSHNAVQLNDVFFSVHAFILCLITFIQVLQYGSLQYTKLTSVFGGIASAGLLFVVGQTLRHKLQLIDVLYYLSFVKMGVSLTKYFPQMFLNFKLKSTVGWSIENILLDLGGGIFSLLQSAVDSIIVGNPTPIIGNPVKFGMGLTSMAFDLVFIVQHYYLYPKRNESLVVSEETPLLDQE